MLSKPGLRADSEGAISCNHAGASERERTPPRVLGKLFDNRIAHVRNEPTAGMRRAVMPSLARRTNPPRRGGCCDGLLLVRRVGAEQTHFSRSAANKATAARDLNALRCAKRSHRGA